ncbi:MAG: long-chain fatty acid--CoA ligase [Armatimonadota bacterium]|nr:MAG: long-chain fatty acid--CoA ligase [Armatimonadota bacterium]
MEAERTTIPAVFRRQVARYGDRTALMCKREGAYRGMSWREYDRLVRDLALGLMSLGLEPRQQVAVLCENCPEWVIADLAIISAGAVNVPIYMTLTPKQVEYILADSQSRIAIVSNPEQLQKVLRAKANLPLLEHVICIACPEPRPDPAVLSWAEVMERGAKRAQEGGAAALDERVAGLDPDDLASIIYTSGTTGDPKGVMLTHDNFLSNAQASLSVLPIDERDLALDFLPLSHVFARTCDHYFMLVSGVPLAFAQSVDSVADDMLEVRPTIMIAVPRFYEKTYARVMDARAELTGFARTVFDWALRLGEARIRAMRQGRSPSLWFRLKYALAHRLVYRKIHARLGGRLRFFVSGGGPLSRELAEFFGGVGVKICEGYGLTESSPTICVNRVERVKYGTVGPPIPGVEVRIAEDGEILTRGRHVMQGYFGKEQETAEAIVDGWLRTGDIGVLDEDGYLSITDRKKDIIVTAGGKNVAPQLIENALKTDPFISQIVIHGDKRKFLSALVVPNFEQLEPWARQQGLTFSCRAELVGLREVYAWIEARISEKLSEFARYEQIRRFTILDREFTMGDGEVTPSLKIKRKVVAERYRDLVEAMYRDT